MLHRKWERENELWSSAMLGGEHVGFHPPQQNDGLQDASKKAQTEPGVRFQHALS